MMVNIPLLYESVVSIPDLNRHQLIECENWLQNKLYFTAIPAVVTSQTSAPVNKLTAYLKVAKVLRCYLVHERNS
jgi:hypothetical protein